MAMVSQLRSSTTRLPKIGNSNEATIKLDIIKDALSGEPL